MAVTLGSRNVGDIIKIRENGVPVDFLIVHKGLPPSYYDGSCNGIWVLRKNVHSELAVDGSSPNYPASQVAAWLENTYYNMFDAAVKAGIRHARIPYRYWAGSATAVATGAAGAAVHCFFLSSGELGEDSETWYNKNPAFSSVLDYFRECTGSNNLEKRIAYDAGGTKAIWTLRSIRDSCISHSVCSSSVPVSASTSGMPATDVSTDVTPASSAVPATTGQST